MLSSLLARRDFLRSLTAAGASCLAAGACAEDNKSQSLLEPVHRVAKANNAPPAPNVGEKHPLDPALDIASDSLAHIRKDIVDFTCRITKQERIRGQLQREEYMEAKIRNRKVGADGKVASPLSVYMKFIGPRDILGRECIWVEGHNNNKMRAHEGGVKGRFMPSVWLDPDGPIAMNGQLHPIYDIGIENLVIKLIERGQKEKKFGECDVEFIKNAKINGRACTVLRVIHPIQRPHFEFHRAEIFIDDELQVPVRYAAFYWPAKAGGEDDLLEAYTYTNLKVNVNLTDADFDPNNPNYNF
jgi:hypothetical protein